MIKAKYVWANGVETICEVDLNAKVGKYFSVYEIANQSAKDDIKYVSTPRHRILLRMMDEMREKFGSMQINSCYRTESFNNATPNADKNSCHLRGEAFDWYIGTVSSSKRTDVRNYWERLCIKYGMYGAINYYTHGFHCEIGSDISYGTYRFTVRDYRGTKSDW